MEETRRRASRSPGAVRVSQAADDEIVGPVALDLREHGVVAADRIADPGSSNLDPSLPTADRRSHPSHFSKPSTERDTVTRAPERLSRPSGQSQLTVSNEDGTGSSSRSVLAYAKTSDLAERAAGARTCQLAGCSNERPPVRYVSSDSAESRPRIQAATSNASPAPATRSHHFIIRDRLATTRTGRRPPTRRDASTPGA